MNTTWDTLISYGIVVFLMLTIAIFMIRRGWLPSLETAIIETENETILQYEADLEMMDKLAFPELNNASDERDITTWNMWPITYSEELALSLSDSNIPG